VAKLVENTGDAFPAALSVALPGLGCVECPSYGSVQDLARAEATAGRGATIKSGRAFLAATLEELALRCDVLAPKVDLVEPSNVFGGGTVKMYGQYFDGGTSKVWVGTGSTWPGGTKYECSVSLFGCDEIWATVNSQTGSGQRYMYVERVSGAVNAAGYPILVIEP